MSSHVPAQRRGGAARVLEPVRPGGTTTRGASVRVPSPRRADNRTLERVLPLGPSGPGTEPGTGAGTDTGSLAPEWRRAVGRRLSISDSLLVLLVTFGVQAVWLGPHWSFEVAGGSRTFVDGPTYTLLSVIIAAAWMVALSVTGSRSHRVVGAGVEEYQRVITASMWVFGLVAVVAYSLQYDVARGYVAITFPLGVAVLCAGRWAWRTWLNRRREAGELTTRVLVVGTPEGGAALVDHIARIRTSGLTVVGHARVSGREGEVDPADLVDAAVAGHANAVVITTSAHMDPSQLRDLRWMLEEVGAELIIAPALTGLAGRRVHTRPIDGLSLLHVDGARYDGSMRIVKGLFDRGFALVALLLISPLLIVVGLVVRLTSAGPAFYRQERIGTDGEPFRIWKFRSMADGADAQLMALLAEEGATDRPLFKPTDDQRITPVGRFIRTWSIDELPQLFNVVTGEMSLVGPRPQRPAEVALYDHAARRRLRVKPGLTGLWQVSGRSDVPWEHAVEMDLYYVENWSFGYDLLLIWRTFAAVARGAGAY